MPLCNVLSRWQAASCRHRSADTVFTGDTLHTHLGCPKPSHSDSLADSLGRDTEELSHFGYGVHPFFRHHIQLTFSVSPKRRLLKSMYPHCHPARYINDHEVEVVPTGTNAKAILSRCSNRHNLATADKNEKKQGLVAAYTLCRPSTARSVENCLRLIKPPPDPSVELP